jgi:predicted nicotinamide N-methyase
VPGRLAVWVAREPDRLLEALDEQTFLATDERLPYFATLWPAGEALARAVLAGPALEGRKVLDLGCGVGAAGLAALARGAEVTCLDWEPRALDIVAFAARAQGLAPPRALACDWRRPPPLEGQDRILAADVLYEARNVRPVLAFVRDHLAPRGEAWLADPGRPHAEDLAQAAVAAGLAVLSRAPLPDRPQGATVTLWRLARRVDSGASAARRP